MQHISISDRFHPRCGWRDEPHPPHDADDREALARRTAHLARSRVDRQCGTCRQTIPAGSTYAFIPERGPRCVACATRMGIFAPVLGRSPSAPK